jgi:hypothetical protein
MPEFAKELALNDFVDWNNLECRLYISKDVNWQIVYKFTFQVFIPNKFISYYISL